MARLTAIEICAGAGGQAIGLEQAGFDHVAVVELDRHACATLRRNRNYWNTVQDDVTLWNAARYKGRVDLFAGGVPCPPFSKAGKQLGPDDERDLFPAAVRLIRQCAPKAIMLENVRGLLDPVFEDYREELKRQLGDTDKFEKPYTRVEWRLLNASDFGVPQLRPRAILVALQEQYAENFQWPLPTNRRAPTVGETLHAEMASAGWEGADAWRDQANAIAPTLVGGSTKHGGPDLGPTRAKRAWAALGVNAHKLAEVPPQPGHEGMPHLTVRMAALLQGFPHEWEFAGKKTHAYRQVGNAFPPPVARAVGTAIATAIREGDAASARSRAVRTDANVAAA